MASQPPSENPSPGTFTPEAPPHEIDMPTPDFDQPSPGTPAGDPGSASPAQM